MKEENEQAASELAKKLGYDKVYFHQQFRETPLKQYSLFDTDVNKDGFVAIIFAHNGDARLASSSEGIDISSKDD